MVARAGTVDAGLDHQEEDPVEHQPAIDPYAVRFEVEYPERELNRVSSFFRVFVAVPIEIRLYACPRTFA